MGRLVAILGHLGATLGRPWVVLGLFWAVLGCSLAPFCGYRANFENHQKTYSFCWFFQVWGRLERDLVAVLERLGRS